MLQSPVLWTDDTPVTVLVGGEEGSRKGRFWTYIGEQHPYSVYDFTESRARDGPAQFLAGFKGYLHADAYGGYDHIYLDSNESVVEVACWAHARRKFFDAVRSSPRQAYQVLEWVGQLYDIEDRARESSVEARVSLRQQEAVPVLDRIDSYLIELERSAIPKSVLRKAVSLRSQPMAGPSSLHGGWSALDRQQRERANPAASGHWPKELAVSRQQAGRSTGCRAVHYSRRSEASPNRALGLPERNSLALACRRSAPG